MFDNRYLSDRARSIFSYREKRGTQLAASDVFCRELVRLRYSFGCAPHKAKVTFGRCLDAGPVIHRNWIHMPRVIVDTFKQC